MNWTPILVGMIALMIAIMLCLGGFSSYKKVDDFDGDNTFSSLFWPSCLLC